MKKYEVTVQNVPQSDFKITIPGHVTASDVAYEWNTPAYKPNTLGYINTSGSTNLNTIATLERQHTIDDKKIKDLMLEIEALKNKLQEETVRKSDDLSNMMTEMTEKQRERKYESREKQIEELLNVLEVAVKIILEAGL